MSPVFHWIPLQQSNIYFASASRNFFFRFSLLQFFVFVIFGTYFVLSAAFAAQSWYEIYCAARQQPPHLLADALHATHTYTSLMLL